MPLRAYVAAALACIGVAWIVSLAWWLLLPETRTIVLEIPVGTAAAVARGEAIEVIPSTLSLRRGDILVVRNDDNAVHRIGAAFLVPATTTRIAADEALFNGASLLCSIHPSGAIGISPITRPGLERTLIPTLLAGVPMSVALLVAMAAVRHLEPEASGATPG